MTDDERTALIAAISDFARRRCGSHEELMALTDGGLDTHSREVYAEVAALGWFGVSISEEYGGAGGGTVDLCAVLEETSRALLPVDGFGVSMIAAGAYERFGTDAQRRDVLGGIVNGRVEAVAMSEPEAGSDIAAVRCRAERDGGTWRVNGHKTWISEAHVADQMLVLLRTDTSAERHRGLSMLRVPCDATGVEIRPIETMGGRTVNDVFLTDVQVPSANLVGGEGRGWSQAMAGLNTERLMVAAQALGLAQRAFDETLSYIKERKQFGRPLSAFQALAHRAADLATEIMCARAIVYETARKVDRNPGGSFAREASIAKLKATEVVKRTCLEGMQMMGGYGYATEFPMALHVRRALRTTIYGGTSEIQREVIARSYGLSA